MENGRDRDRFHVVKVWSLKNRLQSGISRSYRMEINKGVSTLSRASAIADKGGMLQLLIWMALKVKGCFIL